MFTQQLFQKIEHLKTSGSHKNQEYKLISENLKFFEDYSMDSLEKFQKKILQASEQLKNLKTLNQENQQNALKRLEYFESQVERTLQSYEQRKRKGHQMITSLTDKVERHFQEIILVEKHSNSLAVEKYLQLNRRVESILKTVRTMEGKLRQQYDELLLLAKVQVRAITDRVSVSIQEVNLKSDKLLRQMTKLEENCQGRLRQINHQKEEKRQQIHAVMEKMISEMTMAE